MSVAADAAVESASKRAGAALSGDRVELSDESKQQEERYAKRVAAGYRAIEAAANGGGGVAESNDAEGEAARIEGDTEFALLAQGRESGGDGAARRAPCL